MSRTPLTVFVSLLAGLAAVALLGCRRHADRAADMPAREKAAIRGVDPAARTFTSPMTGVRLNYPAGWEPTPSQDFALMLLPAAASAARPNGGAGAGGLPFGEHFVSLDIPELPAVRIPGFLPMDQIRNGYLEDLRTFAPGAKSEYLKPPTIPDAKTALVRTVWPGDRPTHVETALLLTHDDRVYILRGRSRAEDEPATRAAFDAIAKSLQWTGR